MDDIIAAFFLYARVGTSPEHCLAYVEMEYQLRSCIESEAERVLDADVFALVQKERAMRPKDAVAKHVSAEELILLLSVFVEPQWLSPNLAQRALQLVLTENLAQIILIKGLVPASKVESAMRTIHAASNRSSLDLRRQRALHK